MNNFQIAIGFLEQKLSNFDITNFTLLHLNDMNKLMV